jgi:hypothetical protein
MTDAPNDATDDWLDKSLEADQLTIDIDDDDDEPVGPPPSERELDAAQQLLAQWQSPDDFSNTKRAMCKRCLSGDYFNRPRLKFLHDAYVLAEFARLKASDSVRLAAASDQWPDGFVKLQGSNSQHRGHQHPWRTQTRARISACDGANSRSGGELDRARKFDPEISG